MDGQLKMRDADVVSTLECAVCTVSRLKYWSNAYGGIPFCRKLAELEVSTRYATKKNPS
jgi:hypothetical protein